MGLLRKMEEETAETDGVPARVIIKPGPAISAFLKSHFSAHARSINETYRSGL